MFGDARAVEDIWSQVKELPCKRGIPVNDFNDSNYSIGTKGRFEGQNNQ